MEYRLESQDAGRLGGELNSAFDELSRVEVGPVVVPKNTGLPTSLFELRRGKMPRQGCGMDSIFIIFI